MPGQDRWPDERLRPKIPASDVGARGLIRMALKVMSSVVDKQLIASKEKAASHFLGRALGERQSQGCFH